MADALKNVKISPFYVRKMKTYFQGLDQDKSGLLTREDHEALSDRFRLLANVSTLRERQARRKIMKLWDFYFAEAAKTMDMTPEVFGKCIASQPREKIISSATHYGDVLFDLIDVNANGVISLDEFQLLQKLFLHDEETALIPFKALDKENKGVIGYEEFSKAVIDFFLPEGGVETETATIFGGLVD